MVAFTSGSVLTAASLNTAFNTQTIATASTSYTLGSANSGEMVLLNGAGTVIVPLDATYNFATGTIIGLYNAGTASWSIAAAGTASTVSGSSTTLAQYSSATLLKTAASTWVISSGGSGSPKASVSSTTGSPSVTPSGSKTIYKWTGNGSVTIPTTGTVEILLVSGGSSGGGEYASAGSGGGITYGTVTLPAGTHTIVVGAGGTGGGATATGNPGNVGGNSQLGPFAAARPTAYNSAGFNAPLTSSITGSSVTYGTANTGRPGTPANSGNGGFAAACCSGPSGGDGAAGVVIVSVG